MGVPLDFHAGIAGSAGTVIRPWMFAVEGGSKIQSQTHCSGSQGTGKNVCISDPLMFNKR